VETRPPSSALPNLDLLRAFAVLCVVGAHWLGLLGLGDALLALFLGNDVGHTGVLLFFVHTSLVLMFSLERMAHGNWGSITWTFYCRRFFRLYPLSILTVLLVIVFRVPSFFTNHFTAPDAATLWSNLTLTQNLFGQRSMLVPMWSLPLEVQMYGLLPFLYFGVRRTGHQGLQFALLCWVCFTALHYSRLHVYFEPLQHLLYAPCFLGGVAAYACYLRGRGNWWFWGWPALILLSCFTAPPREAIAAYLTCLVLGMLAPRFRECPYAWLNRPASTIAQYSYSLYLLHVPVLHYFYEVQTGMPGPLQALLSLIGLMFGCWLTFHLVERPGIRLGVRLTRNWIKPAN